MIRKKSTSLVATRRGQGSDRRLRLFPLAPCRLRRGEIPACGKVMLCLEDQRCGRANGRDNVQVMDRAAWGALLRERKVTGRDASLPAPLWTFLFELVARGTVGALPKPHKGAPTLDPFFAARLECFSLRFGLSGFFRLYSGRGFTYPTSTPTSCSFKIIGISRASSGVCVTRYSRTFGPILRIDNITSTI